MNALPINALDLPVDLPKLAKIIVALMERVERGMDSQANAYTLFQTAIGLEQKVRERTQTLEVALRELEKTNTALNTAKSQIEASQVRLMEAIDSISEGFAHFDADDRLVLCNRNFIEFWPGVAEAVRPGMSFADFSHCIVQAELIADTSADHPGWPLNRLGRRRSPGDPFVIRLTSGRWVQINERLLPDGGTVGIYTDISEIKLAEQRRHERELAEKSILLQSTLDNLAQGVSVFDENLRLVAWNDRFVDLLDLPDWLVYAGARFEDLVQFRGERGDYGSDANGAMALRIEAARRSRRLHTEQTLGDGVVLEVRRDPMPQGGFVTTYTDVTDRRAAAAALNEAKDSLERRVAERTAELTAVNRKLLDEIRERSRIEEALRVAKAEAEAANLGKTRFLAAASHDLLQPLNAARLFVTALSERDLQSKEGELVARIDSALQSVEGLLGALLDISKFDAGAIPIELADFRISTVLGAVQHEFEAVAAAEGLDLRVVTSSAVVRSDPKLLGRILRNLVSNAIRYTLTGRILVGCRRGANSIRIEVWDTGVGIAEADFATIFEEFRQLHTPERATEKSFGLGLAIVERVARTLGHRLRIRSQVGQGSVFSVEVPYGRVSADSESRDVSPAEGPGSLSGATVLVVENEEGVLVAMRELLEGWGCRVVTERSGQRALTELARSGGAPKIAVVDYHLDENENGLEVIDLVRSAYAEAIPGLIITADACPRLHDRIRASKLHALRKPVKPSKLRALMSHLLSGPVA